MSTSVLYMSMSLDGFVAGPNESYDHGLGDGGSRLHEWMAAWIGDDGPEGHDGPPPPASVNETIWRALMDTGAVVAGRATYEMARGWHDDHHEGVPLFWIARDPSRYDDRSSPRVTFLADVAEAMERAKAAAGDRDVLVHGVGVTRLALAAGVLDELQLSVVPIVLGGGRPLFEDLGIRPVELERLATLEGEEGVTHLRYRVLPGQTVARR